MDLQNDQPEKRAWSLARGKVTAIDGPAAAQRLAIDIVNRIRSARPLALSRQAIAQLTQFIAFSELLHEKAGCRLIRPARLEGRGRWLSSCRDSFRRSSSLRRRLWQR